MNYFPLHFVLEGVLLWKQNLPYEQIPHRGDLVCLRTESMETVTNLQYRVNDLEYVYITVKVNEKQEYVAPGHLIVHLEEVQ